MRGPSSIWTEERVAQLKQLWAAGKSCQQIADEFGAGITRNSIIGKSHRLGLSSRGGSEDHPKVRQERAEKKRARRAKHRAKMHLAKMPALPVAVTDLPQAKCADQDTPTHQRCTILTVRDGLCRFPVGDPRDPNFFLCGAPTNRRGSRPYCPHHAEIALSQREPAPGIERLSRIV